ncbi:MAG TPA: glutamine-hydrolyzing carbamoyl-phosphate synthase small subunit [Pelagibacterium sp.]|uniref:glutamine-hydrolyzing carbamoyl-phosphate synthase small subunit n=1 Tax=Pelagibacterium sp. TaxID=1967288 RepID=UPI002C6ECB77|nr:glutamine-hydrolyzing carbamoyl-phosphate synthase small subunit [Pelagibacterium sp.]HWJ88006.1 glutamine-hydrolyzing carbamoyl-phosphate synthase small subunit [Pelagibacterium sp.]
MSGWKESAPTAVLVLRDGTRLEGHGIGASGMAAGEVCFNTAMTGYQEVLTDPSYAGQIVTFTFPHIGNAGTNDEDIETINMAGASGVRGVVVRADITNPSNYRAVERLDAWLKKRGIIGISGVDTRALTALIRENGLSDAVIAHAPDARFDDAALTAELDAFPGLDGLDLAKDVSTTQTLNWDETSWRWNEGYGQVENPDFHIVAIDYGAKRNILRSIADQGARVTVVPATATAEDILAHEPDGIFLSNGPGDPAATGEYAVPTIQALIAADKPIFGICLGHQLLGLALGAKTRKMHQGHHGANHPVKDLTTGKVEITSMNHGFAVDRDTLPAGVSETHISLFAGSNAGLSVDGKPIFSVQYHPEASPGPHDSHYLFTRFVNYVREQKGMPQIAE